MSESKLKPCPFCGGEAIYKSWVNVVPVIDAESGAYIDADTTYLEFTGCEPCGIGFWLADDETEGTTIEKWNRGETMSRYIDVNALIDATKLQGEMMDMIASGLYGLEDMIDAVIEQPTVDAVTVVRCMECKWWHEFFIKGVGRRRGVCAVHTDPLECNAEWYCADGERKDGAE